MYRSKKLKKFFEIKHYFFSRKNGYSKGLYKGLNCGRGSKDKKENIAKNLRFVSKKMRVKKNNLILMFQTHSNKVIEINKASSIKKINSDAMITTKKDIALGVVTADCVPILLFDFRNKIIGCIHAGWKGAFSGIIQNTITKIKKKYLKCKIYASLGPCIGKKSYEVDENFVNKFLKKSKKNKKYFFRKNNCKQLFDLRSFVEDQLLSLNVIVDHVNFDTYVENKKFFSFRRSTILKQSDYGRNISVIKLNLKS